MSSNTYIHSINWYQKRENKIGVSKCSTSWESHSFRSLGVSESRESRSLGSLGVLGVSGVSGVSESQTVNCTIARSPIKRPSFCFVHMFNFGTILTYHSVHVECFSADNIDCALCMYTVCISLTMSTIQCVLLFDRGPHQAPIMCGSAVAAPGADQGQWVQVKAHRSQPRSMGAN